LKQRASPLGRFSLQNSPPRSFQDDNKEEGNALAVYRYKRVRKPATGWIRIKKSETAYSIS
jgi:hypothetical protein